jgi:hypothetical protein
MFNQVDKQVGIGDFIEYNRTNNTKAYGVIVEVQRNNRDWQRPIGFTVDWIINGDRMLDTVFASGYDSVWSKAKHK